MGTVRQCSVQNVRGTQPVNIQKEQTSKSFIPKRSWWTFGESTRACCCLSCWITIPASLRSCNANNWIVWPVRVRVSARTTGPAASFMTTPDPTVQESSARSWSSWAGKHSSTHCTAETLQPSTLTCSRSWATPYHTRGSPMNMTKFSACRTYLPLSLKSLILKTFKICPKHGSKWPCVVMTTLIEWNFLPNTKFDFMEHYWNCENFPFNRIYQIHILSRCCYVYYR